MPKNHLVSPEQPSFELPSLPPWRTPKIKILHHTPSRRRSLLDDGDIFETPQDGLEPTSARKNPDVYDYAPLCDKKLLASSKVDQLLMTETATHCLVFHKDKHSSSSKQYRPDLDLWCCDSSDEEPSSSSTEQDSLALISGASTTTGRPNVRRFENNANTEKTALKEFWGSSEIPDLLDRSQLRDIYTILQQERDLIHRCERQMRQNTQVPHHLDGNYYQWLRKYCTNTWEKDSWMLDGH